ncbi:flagellar biosynthetic protein FliR [Thalassovita taeanensis]|uniref:Flagellar biosynthetic protein FliR n=1 Tax=Thalassovita taeanensis TaxID=657014 RepID=A0A1H9CIY5_9RHOB|nr:flagellar biosynthetic protein FliR [Thalassovita taeanensis]SEQ01155.1 flagellar biosynthetic protein FliR [Thalassovita taeanensis]
MTGLAALTGWAEEGLWHIFLVFFRVGAVVSLLPAFGEHSVPARVKLAAALAFTLIVAPSIPLFAPEVWALPALIHYLLTETLSGLVLGMGFRLFVLALQTAGSIAAQSTSLAQVFGNAGAEPMPAIGHILVVSGLALAVMTGLHVRGAALMILSYEMLPPGTFPDPTHMMVWGVGHISMAFSLAFTLAAPFLIISLLYNLTLGVINRAMPQLMVAFVGAPAITAGGLALLLVLSPLMLTVWMSAFNAFMAAPTSVLP